MTSAICETCSAVFDDGKISGRFDFRRPCCRARFLVALPTRDSRVGWLGHWRRRGVPADELEAAKSLLLVFREKSDARLKTQKLDDRLKNAQNGPQATKRSAEYIG